MFVLMLRGVLVCIVLGSYWMSGIWLSHYNIRAKRWPVRFMRIAGAAALFFICRRWTMIALIGIHLVGIFALTEGAAALIRRTAKNYRTQKWYVMASKIYRSCLIPMAVTAAFMGFGVYNMSHIVKTEYTVVSDKLTSDYRIVFLSDIHYDTIQDTALLEEKIGEINALQPDAVILGGDIVEEGTSDASMRACFELLGGLESTYGTYYVYGNHDRQRYVSQPAYTESELAETIEKNGIRILCDDTVMLGDELVMIGREDAGSRYERMTTKALLADVPEDRFLLLADHQPVEFEENERLGIDLQLSGHTHAGQIFPIGLFNIILDGINYGCYEKDDSALIVSSGVAGWGFPVRTQGKSEYVVVHVKAGG